MEIKAPFLGCAYYPEDWPEEQIPYDIQKMKEAGIRCARIGEFAWRKMEPKRGVYDFTWLHKVVNALGEAGIYVVMGTPTATPPIWLSREYPDVLNRNADGTRVEHGGRRHCCSNNPHYLEASDAIVEAMGREFGEDPYIIGWQLDNEIYTGNDGCVCPHCMDRFHKHLKDTYGTVENLNARWNLNLFSQAYDSFNEVPPAVNAWHNPHMKYEWEMAHHIANIEFMHRQAAILKKYTKAPIGTDMMPLNGMGYEEMTEPLDVVMFNHYNVPENLNDEIFWFNFLRPLKERPFWNTETATIWNGSTAISQFLKPEGYCRLNSWLPIALGGESNMYWLFRQHWAGHELVHGSVLTPEGRPVHTFGEIQQTSAEYDKAAEFLKNNKIKTPVAMHFTSRSWNLFRQQKLYADNDYLAQVRNFHHAIFKEGVLPDVIDSTKDPEAYKVVFSPLVMTLEDRDLKEKMRRFVENGGVWVAGPMTDIRNDIGAHYTDKAMGLLEEMLGIRQDYQIPNNGLYLKADHPDGRPADLGPWVECYTVPEDAKVIVKIAEGHSALKDEAVISEIAYGKGKVIVLGTMPSETGLSHLIRFALSEAGVQPYKTEGSLLVIPRGEGLILCETAFQPAKICLEQEMVNVLTGETVSGELAVSPYDVVILQNK